MVRLAPSNSASTRNTFLALSLLAFALLMIAGDLKALQKGGLVCRRGTVVRTRAFPAVQDCEQQTKMTMKNALDSGLRKPPVIDMDGGVGDGTHVHAPGRI